MQPMRHGVWAQGCVPIGMSRHVSFSLTLLRRLGHQSYVTSHNFQKTNENKVTRGNEGHLEI